MELALLVYAISVIDKLQYALAGITVLGGIALGVLIFSHMMCRSEVSDYGRASEEKIANNWWVKMTKRWAIITAPIVICSALLQIVVPTERTAYIMVGAYAAQQVAQSETTKKILDVVNKKLEHALDEAMNEIESTTTKEKKRK